MVVGDRGIEVVKTGVDSEIEVNAVVGDDRTEVVSTGMDVIGSEIEVIVLDDDRTEVLGNGIEDEDSVIRSDVVLGIGVVVGTEVVKVTLDEDSINIEIEFVGTMNTVGSKMVEKSDGGIDVVGTEIEIVTNDKFGTEIDVIIGAKVFVGTRTEFVEISIIGDSEIEPEIVGTRIEFVGITGKDEMDVIIELVGCGKEVEVVLMDTVELSTAEEVTTSEDDDTKLELVIGVAVVVGNGVGGVPQNWYSHDIEYVPISLIMNAC